MENITEQELAEAKEMFRCFSGSHFHMLHDGVNKKYKSFGIDKPTEAVWRQELMDECTRRLAEETDLEKIRYTFWEYQRLVAPIKNIGHFQYLCSYINDKFDQLDFPTRVLLLQTVGKDLRRTGFWHMFFPDIKRLLEKTLNSPVVITVPDAGFFYETEVGWLPQTPERWLARAQNDYQEILSYSEGDQ